MRHHFKNAADGIAGAQHLVDFFLHPLLGFGISAVEQNFRLRMQFLNLFPRHFLRQQ